MKLPRSLYRIAGVWSALLLIALLLAAGPAEARGKCGQSISHACGISSPGLYSGSVRFGGETTFYKFYARRATVLTMTLVDTGPSEPCAFPTSCGQIIGYLYENSRHPLSHVTPTLSHNTLGYPTASTTFTVRLPATVTYVWDVAGEPSRDQFGRNVPEPYGFGISVAPGNAQVLGAPPTVVRAPRARGSLGAWRRAVVRAHCVVGGVLHVHSRVRRGQVIGVIPKAGTELAAGTRVYIIVSAGRSTPRARVHRRLWPPTQPLAELASVGAG